MEQPIIRVEHVSYAYGDQNEEAALSDLSLEIGRGEYVAIIGHNGSGKSTLAKLLNGIFLPTHGKVFVEDIDTSDPESIWEVRRRVGLVFQNPDNQMVATIVEEDVAFGPENLGMPPQQIRLRVDDALGAVKMSEFAQSAPHMLSGGQKQRVAIAGVIAMHPKVLVLDEPTAMLDPLGRVEVVKTVERLNREEGITVVHITHFMEEAVLAGRVVVMDQGRIVCQGTPREVFAKVDFLRDIGLDAPKMSRLRAALAKRGVTLPEGALTVEEMAGALLARRVDQGAENADCRAVLPDEAAEENAQTVISLENVSHIYMPGTPFESAALREVSLHIGEGSFVALIGHTGSGKSTLVQHMNALIKPTSGKVIVYGQDPEEKGVDKRRIRALVGMVFQYPEHQLFEETVYKDIAFGPNNLGLNRDEVEKRVYRAMEMVGLNASLAERSPFELSGGQRRRVAIAGVIAMQPRTLILDEPTAGLDPSGRKEILSMIEKLHRKQRNTVVMVTHSMDDAAAYSGRVVVMNRGEIFMKGSPAAVFSQAEQLSRLSLGIPETTQLILSLCARGMVLRQDIFDIEILADELAGRVLRDD